MGICVVLRRDLRDTTWDPEGLVGSNIPQSTNPGILIVREFDAWTPLLGRAVRSVYHDYDRWNL